MAAVTVSENDVALFLHVGETTWGIPIVGVTCTNYIIIIVMLLQQSCPNIADSTIT